ncbi:MAG: Nif3-like dinuclear metal center hexameric protein [Thiotrichales bacterium]|nr:MAG: Nif3-like dinuclear metal center hexameric protein [Thiotrichales bacterium]
MAKIKNVVNYLHELLDVDGFRDYAPNGLQVQGKEKIKKMVTGVSATRALIEAAIEKEADVILVHHGWFWDKEDPRIIGMKQKRLKLLMENDINLLAYHLPLDAHPELGNNAQLAKILGIRMEDVMDAQGIGNFGRFEEYMSLDELGQRIEKKLAREPLLIHAGDHAIRRIAWCTGGAQGYIDKAIKAGVDAFISGEISEHTVHSARENNVHYIAAGHHATERYGVQALGEHVAAKFGLLCEFVDIDNPA